MANNTDYGHELTDKELEKLEKRIAQVYNEAAKELQEKIDTYFKSFAKRDEEMKKLIGTIQNGKEWTEKDYQQWRLAQIGRGKRFETLRDQLAERMTKANEVAAAYINDATPSVYSLNRNYTAYTIEQVGGNVGFTLWDESTVKRLLKEEPDLMPYYPPERAVKRGIDLKWGKKQITNQITQSILQGENLKSMANRLQKNIPTMNRNSAIRAARTAFTSAQNAGRMDSYKAAEGMGIKVRKRWVTTKDGRTRHSHRRLDGETIDWNKEFSNGCRYPGDPRGKPAEIYNCRCTLRTVEKDGIEAEPRQMRVRDPKTGKNVLVNEMTYDEWEKWKKSDNNDIIKNEKLEINPVTLKLSNLKELEKWQNDYYEANSGVSFSKADNPNISTYSGGAYSAINAVERGGDSYEKAIKSYGNLDKYKKISEGVSSELSKFKLTTDLNVKRVVGDVNYITGNGSSIDEMIACIGKTYTEKGFTSTTIAQDAQLPFGGLKDTQTVLDIVVPKSTRGAYIYKMADNPAEFEFLIDKGTTYKILDAGERMVKKQVFDFKTRVWIEKEVPERYIKLKVISQ